MVFFPSEYCTRNQTFAAWTIYMYNIKEQQYTTAVPPPRDDKKNEADQMHLTNCLPKIGWIFFLPERKSNGITCPTVPLDHVIYFMMQGRENTENKQQKHKTSIHSIKLISLLRSFWAHSHVSALMCVMHHYLYAMHSVQLSLHLEECVQLNSLSHFHRFSGKIYYNI